MAKIDPGKFARAVIRLQAHPDWNTVLEHIEHQYDVLKDRLVTCADADQTATKGEARALRRLLAEVHDAPNTVSRLEATARGREATGQLP